MRLSRFSFYFLIHLGEIVSRSSAFISFLLILAQLVRFHHFLLWHVTHAALSLGSARSSKPLWMLSLLMIF